VKSAPAGPNRAGRLLKAVLRLVVPIASIVAAYYLTRLVFGTMLVQKFGDVGRQVAPAAISLMVGGIARQIMRR